MAAKRALVSNSVLVHFDPSKKLVLTCNVSQYGIGAVLANVEEDSSQRPIAFASRTLSPAEKNYSQFEKEGLAIVYGVKKFHSYLYGRRFTIHSDHQQLRHLFGSKKEIPPMAASRIQRWAVALSAYEYSIKYRAGKTLQNADALSRLPLCWKVQVPVPGDIQLLQERWDAFSPVTAKQIRSWTEKDPLLSRVLRFVRQGWPHRVEEGVQPSFRRRLELSVVDNWLLWGA